MRTSNFEYTNLDALSRWMNQLAFSIENSILVQIFSGIDDEHLLKNIATTIKNHMPHATLIGASTAGEILEGELRAESIIVSVSIFESVTLVSKSFIGNDSYVLGEKLAASIVTETTKAIIIFADGIKCNGESILKGLSKTLSKEIIVSGGMAGDNNHFKKTFVMHEDAIFENGVVAVSLNSENLLVHNSYNLSWRAIGIPMTVTKANGNVIYEINNQPITQVYRDYLGDDVVENFPDSVMEFPLIFYRTDMKIARTLVAADKDSVTFAGEMPEGTQVRFGVASGVLFNQGSKELYEINKNIATESLFIYSCIGRKMFLDKEIETELKPLATLAPTSGFFTYGELYSQNGECQMLNITTTVLGLSESPQITKHPSLGCETKKRVSLSISALIHLVEKTMSNLEVESQERHNTIAILNQYQKAIDQSFIISQTDIHGNIVFVNDLFCEVSGYPREELIGRPHSIVRHQNVPSSLYVELWETIKAKKIWKGIIENRRKTGLSYYVDATIFPLFDKDENITSFVGIRNNITDIKHQKDRAEAILNAQDSIVLLTSFVDEKMQVKQLNQKFFEIFAYKDMEDFLSKHSCICDLFIEKEGYLATLHNNKNWLETLVENQDKAHLTLFLDKNNNQRIFSVKAKEIKLETETFIISTFTDVTALENARIDALSAEKAKSAFLATMSHELRTPLNAVIGFSQILMSKEELPLQSMKGFIEKINISGRHLLGLVNNILDFSKVESGKTELNKKVFSLSNLIDETLSLVENEAIAKTIQLTKKDFTETKILADEQLLRQIFLNILSNAIKFSHHNSNITIAHKITQKDHVITICDEGIGLTQEQIAKLFKPFSQIQEHQNQAIIGTGLGLAISKKLIELHHGKIEVTSTLTKGSCFSIYLPIYEEKS